MIKDMVYNTFTLQATKALWITHETLHKRKPNNVLSVGPCKNP